MRIESILKTTAAAGGLILSGTLAYLGYNRWQYHPINCSQFGEYGQSTITVQRALIGRGVQNLQLEPEILLRLIKLLVMEGKIPADRAGLPTPKWLAIKSDIMPARDHVISIAWSNWQASLVLVDGKPTDFLQNYPDLGEDYLPDLNS